MVNQGGASVVYGPLMSNDEPRPFATDARARRLLVARSMTLCAIVKEALVEASGDVGSSDSVQLAVVVDVLRRAEVHADELLVLARDVEMHPPLPF